VITYLRRRHRNSTFAVLLSRDLLCIYIYIYTIRYIWCALNNRLIANLVYRTEPNRIRAQLIRKQASNSRRQAGGGTTKIKLARHGPPLFSFPSPPFCPLPSRSGPLKSSCKQRNATWHIFRSKMRVLAIAHKFKIKILYVSWRKLKENLSSSALVPRHANESAREGV